ncbi:hypothetical protein BH24ACT13_BH24ACT13_13590 [soil metagenome]
MLCSAPLRPMRSWALSWVISIRPSGVQAIPVGVGTGKTVVSVKPGGVVTAVVAGSAAGARCG